ncbi:MAG TPA: fluoride efflux transporter CrcB [Burkholderiaceae bacterium]|nr:fluoride efflux transporter CrcB [Burkholderiaceae bacterium]
MTSVLAICLGACLGALSRWQLGLWLNPGNTAALSFSNYPWGTLLANLLGGYLVGLCIAVFQSMPELDPVWKLALITGFLGALTTFSTFSAEVVNMLQQGRLILAFSTATVHVLGSLLLTWMGLKTATWLLH